MKNIGNKIIVLAVLILTLLSWLLLYVYAQEQSSKILFLHLQWKENTIHLKSFSVVPGKIKQRRYKRAPVNYVRYETFSSDSQKIGEGMFPHPLRYLRHEYADRQKYSQAKLYWGKADSIDFTIRVPYQDHLKTIDFYGASIALGEKVGHRKKSAAKMTDKLGTIVIELPEKTSEQ